MGASWIVASSMLRFPRSKGKILGNCRYQAITRFDRWSLSVMAIYRQTCDLVHVARALKHSSVDPSLAYQSTPSWLAQKANLPVLS
jgi:hypothetical protein